MWKKFKGVWHRPARWCQRNVHCNGCASLAWGTVFKVNTLVARVLIAWSAIEVIARGGACWPEKAMPARHFVDNVYKVSGWFGACTPGCSLRSR